MKPLVSVIMPVYNAEDFLSEAIESILNQTLENFEFLIYNDGSNDRTHEIISNYKDPRIKYTHFSKNQGYLNLLNLGLEESIADFIARMDADDFSYPERLEEQYNFMLRNPNIIVCGSYFEYFGKSSGIKMPPIESNELKYHLFYGAPIPHPTVMFNNKMLKKNSFKYDEDFYTAEDYELFWRISLKFEIACIPKVLLRYRIHSKQIGSAKWQEQKKTKERIQAKIFVEVLKNNKQDQKKWFEDFFTESQNPSKDWLTEVNNVMETLIKKNSIHLVYNKNDFENAVFNIFPNKVSANIQSYFYRKFITLKKFRPVLIYKLFTDEFFSLKYFKSSILMKFVLKCLIFYKK